LQIPDGANLYVDLSDMENSTATGFQDTSVDAIPFQSKAELFGLTLNLGIRQRVAFGVEIEGPGLVPDLALNAGVYVDVPTISATVQSVSNVDANCESLDSSNAENKDLLRDALSNPLRIDFATGYEFGIDALAEVRR
jgi:hypothetical protein